MSFLILPAILYYMFHPSLAYIAYLAIILLALCGVWSFCPICNTKAPFKKIELKGLMKLLKRNLQMQERLLETKEERKYRLRG